MSFCNVVIAYSKTVQQLCEWKIRNRKKYSPSLNQ